MAVTEQFRQDVLTVLDEVTNTLDSQSGDSAVPFMPASDADRTVSMPAVKYDKDPTGEEPATPVGYYQIPVSDFYGRISAMAAVVEESTQDLEDAKAQCRQATEGAENVDATIAGMTVTVTDRTGQSHSVNIGFEISADNVYPSREAMTADAANVLPGRFCMIANHDVDDPDNATLWTRNSEPATSAEPFTYLSDLDQASSAAFDDWLSNIKPEILRAISDADTAARDALEHGTYAYETGTHADHAAAEADTQADRARAEADTAAELNAHPPYIGDGLTGDKDYWYIWSLTNHRYVKRSYAKGDDLHYDEMTPAERQRLIDDVRTSVISATLAEAVAAAEELT